MKSPTETFCGTVSVGAIEMAALVLKIKRLEKQVTELQRANTAEVERRRALEDKLKSLEGEHGG